MGRFKISTLAFLVCVTSINCKEYFRVCRFQHYTLNVTEFIPNLCSHVVHEVYIVEERLQGERKNSINKRDKLAEKMEDPNAIGDGNDNSTDLDGEGIGGDSTRTAAPPKGDPEDPNGTDATDIKNVEDDETNATAEGGASVSPGEGQGPAIVSDGPGEGRGKEPGDPDLFPYTFEKLRHLADLKNKDHSLKVLLTSQDIYSDIIMKIILQSTDVQYAFALVAAHNLVQHELDGMEVLFDYYVNSTRTDEERKAFASFVEVLKEVFRGRNLTVVASVPIVNYPIEVAQQVVKMSKDMEFLTIKAFGFHKDSMRRGHNAPLYSRKHNSTVNWTMHYWINLGVESSKLVMGIQFHVRCYTLDKITYQINYGREKDVEDNKCPPTVHDERISFRKICRIIGNPIAKRIFDGDEKVPYLVFEKLWIGLENPRSLLIKGDYVMNNNFGGWALWDITLDDYSGLICGDGTFPLLTSLNLALIDYDVYKGVEQYYDIKTFDNDWPLPLSKSDGEKKKPPTQTDQNESEEREVSEASKIGSNLLINLAFAFFCFTF